ncbi:hypothetical protein BUALT_Bualt01G0227300 [Buddleja alternifolia]|uniref:C3H1-type domain-containing protein n=1 Tax=Buddleja alternifolia TaxID=168488 RepID=A0AAV6YJT1_9LAMI|nr:hypothetical protein BUALT_Bualt01G0227300 [Buddleja alternifolia]
MKRGIRKDERKHGTVRSGRRWISGVSEVCNLLKLDPLGFGGCGWINDVSDEVCCGDAYVKKSDAYVKKAGSLCTDSSSSVFSYVRVVAYESSSDTDKKSSGTQAAERVDVNDGEWMIVRRLAMLVTGPFFQIGKKTIVIQNGHNTSTVVSDVENVGYMNDVLIQVRNAKLKTKFHLEMECHQGNDFAGGDMVKFQSGNSGNSVNEKRKDSVDTNSKSNHEGGLLQFQSENEPSNKRAKNSLSVDLAASNMSKAIGRMFFRTKVCSKFQAGTCRYTTNCNFAHSMEELREPPSNWQEIVAAHKEEPPREVLQIPVVELSDGTAQGYTNRQYCKKFHTEKGCLYGDCTFLHDELTNERQTEAVCLVAGSGYGQGSKGIKYTPVAANWKTKTCTKWELTGNCAYGDNCIFAHGAAGIISILFSIRSRGGLVKPEVNDSSTYDTKHGPELAKASASTVDKSVPCVPHSYRIGAPSRKLPKVMHKTGEIPTRRWKGPDKISKIYGDWIDDLE